MKTQTLAKGDTPSRGVDALTDEAAASWRRLQAAKNRELFFEEVDALRKEH